MTEFSHYTCTNCGENAGRNYCSNCGQQRFSRDHFKFRNFFKDMLTEFFDVDSSILITLRTLILNPGKLTTDYLEGKQKMYIGPVKLYITIIAINFLVYTFWDSYSLVDVKFLQSLANVSWIGGLIAATQQRENLPEAEFYHHINSRVNDIFSLLLYLVIFVQAAVLKLQFSKRDRYYMEHLIFSLHFMSFGFLRDVLLLPLQVVDKNIAFVFSIATTIAYLYFALRLAYSIKGFPLILHTLVQYAIFFLFFSGAVVASVVLAVIT